MSVTTQMALEIAEIPAAVQRLLREGAPVADDIAGRLLAVEPLFLSTVARGSSDHACGFLKYAFELEAGLPVASLGPSIASVYHRKLKLSRSITLAVSQSGRSPDILAMTETARSGGSFVVALLNKADAPLVASADCAFDILAGPELSVAATKSFVNSAVAGLMLLVRMVDNPSLALALERLPEVLDQAISHDWSQLLDALDRQSSLFILGRGPSYPIACEAALKFKETSGLHAESYSAAEVMHGPVSLVRQGFPILAFATNDESRDTSLGVCRQLVEQGGRVFVAGPAGDGLASLLVSPTGHGLTDALSVIVSFYAFAEKLSRKRGLDPDNPLHLRKVTQTV